MKRTQHYARMLTALAYGHDGRLKPEVMETVISDGRLPAMIDRFEREVEVVLADVLGRPARAATGEGGRPDMARLGYSPARRMPAPWRELPVTDLTSATIDAVGQPIASLRPGDIPDTQESDPVPAIQTRRISIPNAQQGQTYRHDLRAESLHAGEANTTFDMSGDTDGLACSPEGVLAGVIAQAGSKTLQVRVSSGDRLLEELTVSLACIPDPRSLWQDLPTDPEAPYPKADQAVLRVDAGEGWAMVHASQRGRSHAHAGKHRDDDGTVVHLDGGWNVLIAADGAGSCRFSRRGSELATGQLVEHLRQVLSDDVGDELETAVRQWRERGAPSQLEGSLVKLLSRSLVEGVHKAYRAIEAEAQNPALSPRDFSTTLLAAVHKRIDGRHVVASFGVGDGAIAAMAEGDSVTLMNQIDSGSHAGQTRFLDAELFRTQEVYSRLNIRDFAQLDALVLSTDGVTDPKFDSDNQMRDNAAWRALFSEISPALRGTDEPGTDPMIDYLDFFARGHHDDRTLSVLYPVSHGRASTAAVAPDERAPGGAHEQ